MQDASIVARAFGFGIDGAEEFVATSLPKLWKPRVLFCGIWDTEISAGTVLEQITRIVELRDFPIDQLSVEIKIADKKGRDNGRKIFKDLRNDVLRWLYRLEDAGSISLRNGGSLGNGIGNWISRYSVGDLNGSYTASVVRSGAKSAMLIASLVETSKENEQPGR